MLNYREIKEKMDSLTIIKKRGGNNLTIPMPGTMKRDLTL